MCILKNVMFCKIFIYVKMTTAKEEGIAEERKKHAINMKNKGLDISFIAECLCISEEEVMKILSAEQKVLQKCNGGGKSSLFGDVF